MYRDVMIRAGGSTWVARRAAGGCGSQTGQLGRRWTSSRSGQPAPRSGRPWCVSAKGSMPSARGAAWCVAATSAPRLRRSRVLDAGDGCRPCLQLALRDLVERGHERSGARGLARECDQCQQSDRQLPSYRLTGLREPWRRRKAAATQLGSGHHLFSRWGFHPPVIHREAEEAISLSDPASRQRRARRAPL